MLISIGKRIFYFSWEFSHECGLPSLAIIEFFFATEFPGTLLFIRTECVICILQMIRFYYFSEILFIVCQRNVISSKTTEYNFSRQLCASKHLYGKFKFRYFHVNFAFGIVEYVYNIDRTE